VSASSDSVTSACRWRSLSPQQKVEVVAVDLDARKLAAIAAGESYIEDVSDAALQAVRDHLEPTADYARLADADAVLICVPTPLSPTASPTSDRC
jgi:UDP-N-acetyl-D-glucosamine dehydrogenase